MQKSLHWSDFSSTWWPLIFNLPFLDPLTLPHPMKMTLSCLPSFYLWLNPFLSLFTSWNWSTLWMTRNCICCCSSRIRNSTVRIDSCVYHSNGKLVSLGYRYSYTLCIVWNMSNRHCLYTKQSFLRRLPPQSYCILQSSLSTPLHLIPWGFSFFAPYHINTASALRGYQ